MTPMLLGAAFLVAMACAAVMGLAIQRGGTCLVAAVDELIRTRRANRLLAIAEASLWVAGGLLLVRELGLPINGAADHPVSRWTLVGSVLLGIGAWVNGACVIGALARLGSGEWAFAATPVGFFAGCASVGKVLAPMTQASLPTPPPLLGAPAWTAWLFVGFVGVRLVVACRSAGGSEGLGLAASALPDACAGRGYRRAFPRALTRPWSPHAATTVIGITFLSMVLLVGAWAYTDVLAELARGMASGVTTRVLLALALLAGVLMGGWITGRLKPSRVSARALGRAFCGGVLMGWGSLLVPGGNDGLLLLAMPMLWPYAWVAVATMCSAIALGLGVQQRWRASRQPTSIAD